MAKSKHTMKKLIGAAISLLLCLSMLIGTTFAWFTDTVSSANNKIVAGNLDVQMEYMDASGNWLPVTSTTNVFEEDALWEPGYTQVVYLKLSNPGTLALKYELGIHVVSETAGINLCGESLKLSEHIRYGVIRGKQPSFNSRNEAVTALENSQPLAQGYTNSGSMEAGQEMYLALVVYMPASVGNEANYRGEVIPSIDLGLDLLATQFTKESDSFGSDYDKNATWNATNYSDLLDALAEGGTVKLGADIALAGEEVAWDYNGATNKAAHLYIPENVEVTLDLNGHTLSNTHVSDTVRYDVIANYGTLTVTDTVGGGTLISDNNAANVQASGGFAVYSCGDLLLQEATINSNTGSYAVYIEGEGNTLTVDNATVSGRGALAVYNGAHGIVNSGNFTIDVLTTNARDNVLALYNATAEVYGGNFDGTLKTLGSNDSFNWKGSSCVMLMGSTSEAKVYGGTFKAREADLFSHGAGCKVYAYGGSFNTVNALGDSALHEHNSRAVVEILGGTFIYDPSDYLAEGYIATENNGFWTVTAQ